MQYPDIIKIVGDYGIKKPIYISTVHAIKHIHGQCLMEKLTPNLYHRSKARSWLWKNQSKSYVPPKNEHIPIVHMDNYIRSYSQLYTIVADSLSAWVNKTIEKRFNERHNKQHLYEKKVPFYFEIVPSIPGYSLKKFYFDGQMDVIGTNSDILSLQKKINDVIVNHNWTKITKDTNVRKTPATKLIEKWYGITPYNENTAKLVGSRMNMFNYKSK